MDETNYTTEDRKGQHLTSEERHIIEVRYNKDKVSIYAIAKELGRPYNTVKNEVARGNILFLIRLKNGQQKKRIILINIDDMQKAEPKLRCDGVMQLIQCKVPLQAESRAFITHVHLSFFDIIFSIITICRKMQFFSANRKRVLASLMRFCYDYFALKYIDSAEVIT